MAALLIKNRTFYFKCPSFTQKSILLKGRHISLAISICYIYLLQIQNCASYTAYRRAPQMQHASRKQLYSRHFEISINEKNFFCISIHACNILKHYFSMSFPSVPKIILKKRFFERFTLVLRLNCNMNIIMFVDFAYESNLF